MAHTDPGEQSRTRKRAPVLITAEQESPSLFDGEKGQANKAKALDVAEEGHADRLAYVRDELRKLYLERKRAAASPVALVFVTSDDAHNILAKAANLGYTDDDEARPWFGAIFRGQNWRWVDPKGVPSLRPLANGRTIKTWAWVEIERPTRVRGSTVAPR